MQTRNYRNTCLLIITFIFCIAVLANPLSSYGQNQWLDESGNVITTGTGGNDVITTDPILGGISYQPIATLDGDDTLTFGAGTVNEAVNVVDAFITFGDGGINNSVANIDGNIIVIGNNQNGIWDISAAGSSLTINVGASGSIVATADGGEPIWVENGNLTLNTSSGSVIASYGSTGAEAVLVQNGDMTVNNGGFISTTGDDSDALLASNGSINLTNQPSTGANGTIVTTGNSSDAVFADNTLTVNNLGIIATSGIESHALHSIGAMDVTNAGSISTIGLGSYGLFSESTLNLNNQANGFIQTANTQSHAVFSFGAMTVQNTGNIWTFGDASAGLVSGETINATNAGTIITNGVNSYGILALGDISLNNQATGYIATLGDNSTAVNSVGGLTNVNNAGVIVAAGLNSTGIFGQAVTVDNSGLITTLSNGSESILSAGTLNLVNQANGVISAEGDNSVAVFGTGTTTGNNSGTIYTSGNNSFALVSLAFDNFTNDTTGVISVMGDSSAAVLGAGTFINNGWVTAPGNGSVAFLMSNGPSQITNTGTISVSSAVPAVIMSNADDVFINDGGAIYSPATYSVDMGAGDDTFIIRNSPQNGLSHIDGIINGNTNGAPGDTIVFDLIGYCPEDFANLSGSGTIIYWGETYSWENFENVEVTGISFEHCGITPNQQAIGHTFDCLEERPEQELMDFLYLLASYGCDAFPGIANQLSPQRYEIFSKIAFNNHDFMLRHLNNRSAIIRENNQEQLWDTSGLSMLDQTLDPKFEQMTAMLTATKNMQTGDVKRVTAPQLNPMNDNRFGLFLSGNAIMAEGDGTRDIYDYDWDTYGVVGGADYKLFPFMAIGLMGGYSHTDADLDNYGSDADIESYMIGTYVNFWWNNFYANALFSFNYNEYEGTREVPFLDNSHHFDTDGHQFNLGLSGGYDFHLGNLTLGPTAGIRYVDFNIDGFTESGHGIDKLRVLDDNAESLRTSLGAKATYTFRAGSVAITPELRAAWGHEFRDDSRGITAHFNSGQLQPFTVETTDPERDWAELGGSLRAKFNQTVSAFIDYDANVGQDDFFAHSVQGGLRLDF